MHGELKALRDAVVAEVQEDAAAARPARAHVHSLQSAVKALNSRKVTKGIVHAGDLAEEAERGIGATLPFEAYAVHTGSKPLSMYTPDLWARCFPKCFPYGDGVFGLPREKSLTFQQCASMLLLREELSYDVDDGTKIAAQAWFELPTLSHSQQGAAPASSGQLPLRPACACVQCIAARLPFRVPRQARWGHDRELLCCLYDTWRRMEQVRRAKAHVLRTGWHSKLETICNASAEKIEAAMASVGENAIIRDVLRSADCDPDLKEALAELQIFTTDVVGSDGARAKLRHEQNGFVLMFGPSGGFLTPNMADVRSPLVVKLHGGGVEESYEVNLLDECPHMPSARHMLKIVAEDPAAQARYFILSMRLFCEHVLGSGPVDDCLRHNGWLDGAAFPDGFAASGLGGAYGIIAAFHGPVEEQARLSIHPHMLLWFVNTTSEAWLRSVLRRETQEARDLLKGWQERVLAAVQSTQLDSAAVLPLLLAEDPEAAPAPRSTPFSAQHQKDCRFDGESEGDARDPDKRRPLVATEELFVDHHVREHAAQVRPGEVPKPEFLLPLTGAQLSRMPHYRRLGPMTEDFIALIRLRKESTDLQISTNRM